VLLAVNWHYMSKNRKLLEKQRQEEIAKQEKEKTEEGGNGETGPEKSDPNRKPPPEDPVPEPAEEEKVFELATKEAVFAFTTHGGGIKYAEFVMQFAVGESEKKVRLNRFGRNPVGALTSGTDKYLDIVFPFEKVTKTDRSISFLGATMDGLIVRKTWTLMDEGEPGGPYRLILSLEFENHGEKNVELKELGLFAGSAAPLWKGEWGRHITMFYRKNGDYKKRRVIAFKKGKKGVYERDAGTMGYAGVGNQFFAAIVSPLKPYDAWVWGDREAIRLPEVAGGGEAECVRLGMSLPPETLAAGGGTAAIEYDVFMGPKQNRMLRKIGMGRGEVMSYGGFLGMISRPLNWLLNALHTWVFDPISKKWSWGFAIVALTILIRAAMWPLQNKSTRAMKRMSKLQPQMKEMKEKYPDNPQRMNQEMMKMYREYGINPLGGCLPLLVQIPIFFGFYTMLMYAVELRQQKFLWVDDLSLPDTIATLPFSLPFLGEGVNLLPIVMAVTMVLQMSLTPKTGDKMQRRLFMMMPVIFFFFCYNFASALALYWTTSNIFAIAQMLITRRLPEPELKKKAKGKGFFAKLQARAEEAQKMQKARRAQQMGVPQKKPKKRRPRTGG